MPIAQPSLLRVIIADNDDTIRAAVLRVVSAASPEAEIVSVRDGDMALDAYWHLGGNFVITNHSMPKVDGEALIRELRKYDPELPIVVVSADPALEPKAVEAGASWFVPEEDIPKRLPALLLTGRAKLSA